MDDWRRVSTDNWKYRRIAIFGSLFTLSLVLLFIVATGADTSPYQTTATALIGAITAIINGYAFAAVWDDNGKRRCFRQHYDDAPPHGREGDET